MAGRVIEVVLVGNDTSLRAVLARSATEVKGFGKEIDASSASTERSSSLMAKAFVGVGVAAAAGLAYAVKSAADFEAQMRNVNSISHESETQFASTSQRVLDLSKTLPQSASTLAKGLYDIASSGFQGADGLKVLEASGKAASAGLTDTADAARAITGVLNAYGRGAQDATDVSDVLFQTVNLGVLTFSDLTQGLGNVIGMSAAAGISINEVGAAVAAMTLAGLPAAEAFTALHRVEQQLIAPSDALQTVMRQTGISLKDLKDPAIGFHGVMEKIRQVTGGNVAAIQELFPEIRAATGVFALGAANGENYKRTLAGINDQTQVTGATQRAFDEQMKSLSAEFKIFTNQVSALAIEGASHLLPVLSDVLGEISDLADDAVPILVDGFDRLQPYFEDIVSTGEHLFRIAESLFDAFEPLGKLLLGIAAGAAIEYLKAWAATLEAVSGFLADHAEIVEVVAIAYGVRLVGAFLAVKAQALAAELEMAALKLYDLAGAADAGVAKLLTLGGALKAIAVVGVVGVIYGLTEALQSADAAADQFVGKLRSTADLKSSQGVHEYVAALAKAETQLKNTGKTEHDFGNALKGAADSLPFVNTGILDTMKSHEKLVDEINANVIAAEHWDENLTMIARSLGITGVEADKLAQSMGVELSGGFNASGPARQKIIDHFKEIREKALGVPPAMQAAVGPTVDALLEMAAVSDKTAEAVGKAWGSATDIVKNFKPDEGGGGLGKFLTTTLDDANKFFDQISEAAKRGLDPKIIQELMEAGPAAAKPFLEGVLSDTSNTLIEQANTTHRRLEEMGVAAIESARVTQRAINATSVEMAADYGRAMDIMRVKAELGGAATAQAVADKLEIGEDEVNRVAGEYVIVLQGGLAPMPAVAASTGENTAAALVDQLASRFQPAGEVVAGYSEIILKGLNPILAGVGASTIEQIRHDTGNIIPQAEGGFLPREATFARGTRIQWAEPETEGEWFIPAAKSKAGRSVGILGNAAKHFGFDLVSRYASGGFHSADDVPAPPDMGAYGNWLGHTADSVNRREYEAVRQFIADHPERTGGDGGAIGSGWQAVTAFLDGRSEPYTVTSTTGGNHVAGSLHYQGKAVDLVSGNMMHLFDTLLGITSSLQELFFDPAGFSVKGGQRVDWTVGGHSDHVHAATFDRGGTLAPGQNMVWNGTGLPETLVPVRAVEAAIAALKIDVVDNLVSLGDKTAGILAELEDIHEAFVVARNDMADPNRGRSGYVQAEDGSWVPTSFYGSDRHKAPDGNWYTGDPVAINAAHDPNAGKPGYRQAEDGSWVPSSFYGNTVADWRTQPGPNGKYYGRNDQRPWQPGDPPVGSPAWNNMWDPNRGRSGYLQAEDGSWVPASVYGFARGGVMPYDGSAYLHRNEMVLPESVSRAVLTMSDRSGWSPPRPVMSAGGGERIDYDKLGKAVAREVTRQVIAGVSNQPIQVASETTLALDGRRFGKVVSKTLHSRQVARS